MTTTTTRITRFTALALAGALLVVGCSQADDAGKGAATPTGDATAPALEATEPATEPAVEETTEAVEVPTELGETVPADQVDAAREAGAAVYVSPNGDGSGVVIDPTETPAQLVTDSEEVDGSAPADTDGFGQQMNELSELDRAAEAAGTGVFVLIEAPDYAADGTLTGFQYSIGMVGNVAGNEGGGVDTNRSTKDAAIAAVQDILDQNPGYEIIDLTN